MVNDVEQAGLRSEKVEVDFKAKLEKHLSKNEELCGNCGGLGIKVVNNMFGIKGYKHSKGMTFPFDNQSLSYCPSCYNGVRKRCEHCNKLIAKSWTVCNCETVQLQSFLDQWCKENGGGTQSYFADCDTGVIYRD